MDGTEYLSPYLGSQDRSLSYNATHQYYEPQSYTPARESPEIVLHGSETAAPRASDDSILQDDKRLFENYDRFLAGDIDQQKFQAGYCKRLLFIWEWVFEFCFGNFPSALQSWYQILEKGDVWLWVDGDETDGPSRRSMCCWMPHDGPTDMYSLCILSWAELQRGVHILKNRIQQQFNSKTVSEVSIQGSHTPTWPLGSSLPWRRRLDQHTDSRLRYAAVILKIATSDSIRALDGARRIKGRYVDSLFRRVVAQFQSHIDKCALPCTRWDGYISEMRKLGHTCIYPDNLHASHICILLNFLEVLAPDSPISIPLTIQGFYGSECQNCLKARPLLVADILWSGEEPCVQSTSELTPTAAPSNVLRFLWHLWFKSGNLDVQRWVLWLASLAEYTRCTSLGNKYRSAARLILACLVSPQTETWIVTHEDSTYRNSNKSCFGSGEIVSQELPDFDRTAMYIPTPDDWKAAEATLNKAESVLKPGQELPDILATLGVLFHWISTQSIATPLPDIYTFRNLLSNLYECFEEDLPWISKDAVPSEVKSRIVQEEGCKCCPQVDERILDWYIASAALITPAKEIIINNGGSCRFALTGLGDVTRVFNNFLDCDNDTEVEEVCRALVAVAKQHGYNASIFSMTTGDADSTDNEASKDERITPTTIITPRKPSKSHQIEAVRTHIFNHLRELESATRQIPALSSGGKQKATLPWKTLTQTLKERGYELENWPAEVPLPGSGSELCDDNKGIHGLNAKHLRSLYDATQDNERPLGFRKVGEMVPATVRMEEAARRRGTTRGREASEEREAGTSKRRRADSNGAGPSWDRS